MTSLTDALQWRYATKKFDAAKKVSDADLQELLESLRLSPSSYGIQPWKFLVVTDPKLRAELRKSAWDQSQVTDASHLIVLCAKSSLEEKDIQHYIDTIAKERGIGAENLQGFKNMMMGSVTRLNSDQALSWNKSQVYIALGILLSACALKKIDACPMEGFDSAAFGKILNLDKEGFTAALLCPVGYRAADDDSAMQKKVRFPAAEVIAKL